MDFRVLFRSLKELHLLFFHWLPVINSHKCCSSSQTCSYFIAPCLPQRFACMLFVKLGTVQSMARLLSLWWELSSNPAPPQGTSVSSGTKPRWKWSVHGCEKIKIIQKKWMWHMYVYPTPASGCWQTTVNIWLWQTVHFFLFFYDPGARIYHY